MPRFLLTAVLCLGLHANIASAETPRRVASLNLCTDELLVDLAEPDQIVALGPYAQDRDLSWAADRAARFPRISGTAEEILALKPDLVLAGRFTKRETKEILRAQGFRVEEFDAVRSLDEAKAQIRRMGELLGQPGRAAARIAALDAAISRARSAALARPLGVLPLQRRGWVSGPDSLMTSLLSTIGLRNAAEELGLRSGGLVGLEAIVAHHPDLVLVSQDDIAAVDQGSALLLHPALAAAVPRERWLSVPGRLTVCGGPALIEALDLLATAIARISR